jgi:hypothetical protein
MIARWMHCRRDRARGRQRDRLATAQHLAFARAMSR